MCIAELRGQLSNLNVLARQYDASCIIHSGNFGFFDSGSIARISVKILKQISVFSPLVDPKTLPQDAEEIKRSLSPDSLSELPSFLSGASRLDVPVYTIYGAAEDLTVIEKFRSGEYSVPNLHIIDEISTHAITVPSGHTIRLFGLGGSLVLHRLFDNGDGSSTIAGSPGVMWTTVLQMGQLITTVRKSFDPSEIHVFVSHPAPSREGLLAQLALALRADFTISSGLHFIYGSSFNEFSVLPSFDHYKGILAASRAQFMEVWNAVKTQLLALVETEPKQKQLLLTAIEVFESMPTSTTSSSPNGTNSTLDSSSTASSSTSALLDYMATAYRNMWHFNLCDATFGALVLNVVDGRIATESYSEGFNFQYRRPKPNSSTNISPSSTSVSSKSTPSAPGMSSQLIKSSQKSTTASSPLSKPSRTLLSKPNGVPPSKEAPASAAPTSFNSNSPITSSQKVEEESKELPGIWIANGQGGEEEVKKFFAEPDQKLIQSISIKENYTNPEKMFALVYFSTPEEVNTAIERVDKEAARKVSVIRSNDPSTSGFASSGFSRSRSSWGPSTRGRGSFRGRGTFRGRGSSKPPA